ncbi:MAG: glutathione S-transferase family protein, partial [Pseudomonadota bacterium]
MKKLVTLLPSVDVDLGRWLMQLYQIRYEERPHAPIFHIWALKYHGLGPRDYPALIWGDNKVVAVERIVQRFDADAPIQLLPSEEGEPELYNHVFEFQSYARYTMGD